MSPLTNLLCRLYGLVPMILVARFGMAQTQQPAKAIAEGTVLNSVTGAPLAGARVKLAGVNDELFAKTDSAGRFQFANLDQGGYSIAAQFPGFLQPGQSGNIIAGPTPIDLRPPRPRNASVTVIYGGQARPAPAASVNVDADGTLRATVAISLTPSAAILGKVTDANGMPLAECPVEVLEKRPIRAGTPSFPRGAPLPDGQNELAHIANGTTDDRGEFRIGSIQSGSYYVFVSKPSMSGAWESSYRETYFPHALDAASAKLLELAAGQEVRADIQIVHQTGVRVAGRLIEPAGQQGRPSPGSKVYTNLVLLSPNQQRGGYTAFANSLDGAFEFKDVLPGKYTVQALTRNLADNPSPQNQNAIWAAAKEIEVTAGGEEGLTVTLEPLQSLAGTLTFAEGCTPSAFRIVAQAYSPLGLGQSTATSSVPDGRFVLSELAPGHHTLNINSMQPANMPYPASARLGDRDVLTQGFDIPASSDDALRIQINCRNPRRTR